MDDDEDLGPHFRAAAAGAPPPRFDHTDVVQASDRAVARRRSVLVRGAVALVVLLGVGGVGAAVLPSRTGTAASAASAAADPVAADPVATAPAADSADPATAGDAAGSGTAGGGTAGGGTADGGAAGGGAAGGDATGATGGGETGDAVAPVPAAPPGGQRARTPGPTLRSPAPEAAGPTTDVRRPGVVPLGPGRSACANRQDPGLRALVDEALPDAAGAPATASSDLCLPGGQRLISISYRGGVLAVSYLPPGTTVSPAAGSSSAPTASGGTVVVTAGYARLLPHLAPRL